MANTKEYKIVINGISESVSAVDALNKQLDALEKRIKTLENSNVKVNSGGGNANVLNEEAAVQKEINKLKKEGATLDAKIIAAQDEVYKKVDATKQLYKETVADQKALAAQERLTADAYSNTMQGMKQNLADLKAVINTTDLADTDKIKQMTDQAGALTKKLKEMEEAYGQFGRNVGNYQDAANGFKGLAIQVGDVTQKFDNAKQALKELKKERDTLSTKKDMGLISEEEAKRLQDLIPTVAQLQSSIQDAGKPMDALLDGMQSFVAIMQSTKGISAFFGIDNAEVDKTIKNLVALQNAMQGLQTIQKQIQSREGIGKWIAPFNSGIDKATTKLLVYNKALLGTSTAAKAAAVGINLFSKALKAAVSMGIILAIELVIEKVMDLVESFKKVDDAVKRTEEVQKELSKTYTEASANILKYKTIVENFNGTKEEEKRLTEKLNSELGSSIGQYKNIAEWKDALIKKSEAYIQMLVEEAKAQKLISQLVEIDEKKRESNKKQNEESWTDQFENFALGAGHAQKRRKKNNQETQKALREEEKSINEQIKSIYQNIYKIQEDNKIGYFAPQIDNNTDKTKKALEKEKKELADAEADLIAITIQLMDEGWLKRKAELEHERDERIRQIEQSGKLVTERTTAVIALYNKTIQEEEKKWADERLKTYENYAKQIQSVNDETFKMNQDTKSQNLDNEKEAMIDFIKFSKNYNKELLDIEEKYADAAAKIKQETLDKDYEDAKKEEKDRHDRLVREGGEYEKMLKADKITKEQYDALIEAENKAFAEKMKVIDEKYATDTINITKEALEKKKEAWNNYWSSVVKTVQDGNNTITKDMNDFMKSFNKLSSASSSNPFAGFASYAIGMKKLAEAKDKYLNQIKKIDGQLNELDKNRAKMSKEAYDQQKAQLMEEKVFAMQQLENMEEMKEMLNHILIDAAFNLTSMVINGIFDNMDLAFDKEQEELDKANELLDKQLDKQQDIVQQHKDAIDAIEDELATARGSRRQHLIDQLNAEVEAQRAAQAEEKRIEKEKEANEKKQEALDKKRQKAQYKRDIASIIVSGAQAIVNGYATKPAWVGLVLGPLMATLTAAQLAIAIANKPYAKGGLLEGPSHREGGIPVGNTGIEVEGKEYVIRKKSTAQNIDLLDYINKSERKLDLSDFIDFYSSKVKKSITSSSPRAKYADGGTIPMLNNDYNFDDRLLSAFEDYSNRPVYVSVVDINRRQTAVKNVQVLAGLGE